jgi:hypothetical protein
LEKKLFLKFGTVYFGLVHLFLNFFLEYKSGYQVHGNVVGDNCTRSAEEGTAFHFNSSLYDFSTGIG